MASPVKPTQEMIDAHNVSHLPFRSWCSLCVRGGAVSVGLSHSAPREDEQTLTIAVDYAFLSGASFIVVKDRHTKVLWSIMVPNKGLGPSLYGGKALLVAIEWTGYKPLALKSDKEHSILVVCAWVKAQLAG